MTETLRLSFSPKTPHGQHGKRSKHFLCKQTNGAHRCVSTPLRIPRTEVFPRRKLREPGDDDDARCWGFVPCRSSRAFLSRFPLAPSARTPMWIRVVR